MKVDILLTRTDFFPGEEIFCCILLKGQNKDTHVQWLSAQTHGICEINKNLNFSNKNKIQNKNLNSPHALPDRGSATDHTRCLFISKPTIIAADFYLNKNKMCKNYPLKFIYYFQFTCNYQLCYKFSNFYIFFFVINFL